MMGSRRLECRTLVTAPQLYILTGFKNFVKITYTEIEEVSHAQNYRIQAILVCRTLFILKKKLSNIVRSNRILGTKT